MFTVNELKPDCLHYRGDLPCKPNKQCNNCKVYQPYSHRILIIKLGAIGDVIRTTPLLRKLKAVYPNAKITWLTLTPAILPSGEVHEILKFDLAALTYLHNTSFDILYNLDKDKEACALFNSIEAKEKYGYCLRDGVPYPANELAVHKFMTGMFDAVSQANTKGYVQEIFELTGFEFNDEEYVFDNHSDKGFKWDLPTGKKLIGLNTGCGDRWTTRLWQNHNWVELIQKLTAAGYQPVLLGGEAEHANNLVLQQESGALYLGYFSLPQFINLVHQMDLVVTQVTMCMHISIALQKRMVLMNNIFNPHEFYMYGRGEIVAPNKACECFYLGKCVHGTSCMEQLPASKVMEAVVRRLV